MSEVTSGENPVLDLVLDPNSVLDPDLDPNHDAPTPRMTARHLEQGGTSLVFRAIGIAEALPRRSLRIPAPLLEPLASQATTARVTWYAVKVHVQG